MRYARSEIRAAGNTKARGVSKIAGRTCGLGTMKERYMAASRRCNEATRREADDRLKAG